MSDATPKTDSAGPPEFSGYFFKLPAEIDALVKLSDAELRAYLVIQHAIQRDRNAGKLATRPLAKRARLSKNHANTAANKLLASGFLLAGKSDGRATVYVNPITWKTANCPPTGGQSQPEQGHRCPPTGGQYRTPTGGHNCPPTGGQPSEYLEFERKDSTAAAATVISGYPAAVAAIRLSFPTTDDGMIGRIIAKAQEAKPDLNDEGLTYVIQRATKHNQRSAALYLNTVVEVVKAAGLEANLLYRAAEVEAEREQAQKKAEFDAASQALDERRRRALLCKRCHGEGVVCLPGLLIAWCDCEDGQARQAREPEYVEQYNADMERIAASFKPNGKPKRTAPDPIRDDADFERQRAEEIPEGERVSGDE